VVLAVVRDRRPRGGIGGDVPLEQVDALFDLGSQLDPA
jgi:hypothetical protein